MSVALVIAVAASVVAVGALAGVVLLMRSVSALRRDQRVVVGDAAADVVEFAVALQARVDDVQRAVDQVGAGLARVDRRVDATLANTAVVRYDAYEAHGGHQSSSMAILDAERTGVVVSAIQGRDYARIYVKEIERGKASIALSPEEEEAVQRAMGR